METTEELKVEEAVGSSPVDALHKAFDPYFQRAEMPHSALYFPLGFPLRLTTNSPVVLAAADESWAKFERRFEMEPIQMQVGVREGGSMERPGALAPWAHGALMVGIADAENFFVADLIRDRCFAWITPGALANQYYLRHDVMESAAMSNIANRYCAPIHAACVAMNGRGVLLCGDSGAGKSTLAFACARKGWTYVSDDASFLVHGRQDRQVLGNCHSVRLRADAAELFAEVRGTPLMQRMRGKPSIEMATRDVPLARTAAEVQADFMVFLKRRSGAEHELRPYSKELAQSYLRKHLNWSEELRPNQIASTDRMLSADVYELCYEDLEWAINRLERMVRECE